MNTYLEHSKWVFILKTRTMNLQWMIAVRPDKYQEVISSLKKNKVEITNMLESISVILVSTTSKKTEKIKAMNGVISVELQGAVSI